MQAHYTPREQSDAVAALLPPDARREPDGYRFAVPEGGMEALLQTLLDSGHGIAGLSIERPSLHDVFVALVDEETAESMAIDDEAAL